MKASVLHAGRECIHSAINDVFLSSFCYIEEEGEFHIKDRRLSIVSRLGRGLDKLEEDLERLGRFGQLSSVWSNHHVFSDSKAGAVGVDVLPVYFE